MKGYTKIAVRTWYLEYPVSKGTPHTDKRFKSETWAMPKTDEYIDLYRKIGKDYGWSGRLLMEKAQLEQMLQKNEQVQVFLFFADDKEAGYFEINFAKNQEAEIVYLGLMPEFIGKGYGKAIIHEAVRTAFEKGANRIWLHTCEHDHPHALEIYQQAGFELYDEKIEEEFYPNTHPIVRSRL